ncbi:unnamed protein product, partial [Ixodes hexagonus]
QAEVGKAVEDLLASESTGSTSSSSESQNNSCPELYGREPDHKDDELDAYRSSSVPQAKRTTNGILISKTNPPELDDPWNGTTTAQKTKDDCTWDAYYGWKSLQLSRPPSGDAHLLSIYTERLVEAVNDSFGLYPQELSSEDATDQRDSEVKRTSLNVPAAGSYENFVEGGPPTPPSSQKSESLTPDTSPTTLFGAFTLEPDGRQAERADSGESELCAGDADEVDVASSKDLLDRYSSWPNLQSLRDASVGVQLPNRSGSYPGLAKTVNPFGDIDDGVGGDQVISYDGSLYKNQQLYYEPEDVPDCAVVPAVSVTEGEDTSFCFSQALYDDKSFTEVELRIVDPDEEVPDELPELFIREDDRDNESRATLSTRDILLGLGSPKLGRAQGRLNPYTIEVIANHASTPDEVFATVCTLEAKLASRLPRLEIDEGDPDTGTWSSTSTAHSTSTVVSPGQQS